MINILNQFMASAKKGDGGNTFITTLVKMFDGETFR